MKSSTNCIRTDIWWKYINLIITSPSGVFITIWQFWVKSDASYIAHSEWSFTTFRAWIVFHAAIVDHIVAVLPKNYRKRAYVPKMLSKSPMLLISASCRTWLEHVSFYKGIKLACLANVVFPLKFETNHAYLKNTDVIFPGNSMMKVVNFKGFQEHFKHNFLTHICHCFFL